jgi:hypothetical protein
VARDYFSDIALEDGRTLRLGGEDAEEFRFIDLRGQREPDCGGRSQFKPVFATDTLVVTQAHYDRYLSDSAMRVCLRATGRDPVAISTVGQDDEQLTVVGADREWVVITDIWCWKECLHAVWALQAGTGRRAEQQLPANLPQARQPLAVNEAGVAAWVADADGAARLYAGGNELDSGPPGSLASLRFTGTTLTWTNAGVPKSAEVAL